MPELLPDPVVEARARELGQLACGVGEAHVEGGAGSEVARVGAVDGDVDRLAAGSVADAEHVAGGDDQGTRGEGVGGDVAHHVPLHPPGENRTLVGEVVSGRSCGCGGDQAVAAHVPDLLTGDPVAQLCDPVVRAPAEADVVERESLLAVDLDRQRRQVDRLRLPGQGAADPLLRIVTLDRGEEADRAEVDAEDGHTGAGAPPLEDFYASIEDLGYDKDEFELSEKAETRPEGSGTVKALDAGVHQIGKKLVEEAAESWMAAEFEGRERAAEEISQLLYHAQVLMLAAGISLDDVYAHL